MFFALGQDAEIKKKQSDPIAFILGDDKPMSIGEKVSHLPTKLISAIDLAIRKSYKSALRPHRNSRTLLRVMRNENSLKN